MLYPRDGEHAALDAFLSMLYYVFNILLLKLYAFVWVFVCFGRSLRVWLSDSHSLKFWLFVSNLFATPALVVDIPFRQLSCGFNEVLFDFSCLFVFLIVDEAAA